MTRPCILVVDDDATNLSLMEFLLESFGYSFVLAADGVEALEKLGPGIDLVLLDVMMKGLDGFEVARRIRDHSECGDIPIIMVTVLTSKAERLRAVEAGANDFVTKPVDRVELKVRIESLLKMKEARDDLKRHKDELETTVQRRTAALARSEARYRLLVENAPVGIFLCDPDGNVVDVNSRALEIFGLASPQATRQINVVNDHNLVEAGLAKNIRHCLESGQLVVCEGNYRAPGAKEVCVRAHMAPIQNDSGGIAGVQAILEDVTEQRKAEQAVRESEQRFRAVFETAQDCIFIKDRHLRYTHVNPAMLSLLGVAHGEIIGQTDEDLLGKDRAQSLKRVDSRVLQGQVIQSEHSLTLGERVIAFNCIKVPMRKQDGESLGLCGIARDITESKGDQKATVINESLSDSMRTTRERALLAANSDSIILLLGESGSGKDHMARYIHESSPRASGPFFTINCAAVPLDLAESELFGHESGAFSGAQGRKRGLLELAEGGTLLLNEIGELPLPLQAKLLTFLDTQSFTRVGGEKHITVNARLLAATNKDLREEVERGRFRRDLYYRINVISIVVPPLRERLEDLPGLVEELVADLARKLGRYDPPELDEECLGACDVIPGRGMSGSCAMCLSEP